MLLRYVGPMSNLRSNQRRRMFKAGKIELNRSSVIDAKVKNISKCGAMLEVESVVGIPDDFTLFIEPDRFERSCKIVWRKPTRIGVRFE